ncbi:MAG: universal stress protein [Bauldia sp.]|nr:universal stress protein [Bauldia sp.]
MSGSDAVRRIKNILVAADRAGPAPIALERAVLLAKTHNATVTLLHVMETSVDANLLALEVTQAKARLTADFRAATVDMQNEVSVRVECGSPAAQIVAVADDIDADLIVMGAHRRRTLRARFIGSTTDRVVRTAVQPVLVVKARPRGPYRRVLCATDFSSSSGAACLTATQLASGATLRLAHVVELPLPLEQALLRSGSGHSIKDHRRTLVAQARKEMRALVEEVERRTEAVVRASVESGSPASTLVRAAKRNIIDLLAVGASGRGALAGFFLGHVTQQLLRDAPIDVLTAR